MSASERPLAGITGFVGMRRSSPEEVRLDIRPELLNVGGLLSGAVTYAPVDYCMGSAWGSFSIFPRRRAGSGGP